MRRVVVIIVATALLAAFACPLAWSQQSGDIWLSGFLVLRIRTPAGGYSIDERVNAVQSRANNLLQLGKGVPKVVVAKAGTDAVIYAGGRLFITVTPADAKANDTTPLQLAAVWAQRLRTILPKASPEKPGVGLPGGEGKP
jgi:hypothetical protein